jgi:hypothetical protein
MSCNKIESLIPLFPDDLEPGESALVSEHVAGCAACAAELGQFVAQAARFAQVRESRSASVDLWQGIQSKLAEPRLAPVTSFPLMKRGRSVAAAAAIAALLGVFAWNNRTAAPPVEQPIARTEIKQPIAPKVSTPQAPAVAVRNKGPRRSPQFFDESAHVVPANDVELVPFDAEADVPGTGAGKRYSHNESVPGSNGGSSGDDRSLSF